MICNNATSGRDCLSDGGEHTAVFYNTVTGYASYVCAPCADETRGIHRVYGSAPWVEIAEEDVDVARVLYP